MTEPRSNQPLADDELERLQTLLMTRAVPAGGMNLEMLDGFLSALVVAPADVPSGEYEPLVWGPTPRWASTEEAREGDRLLQRLTRLVRARIAIDPDREKGFMPLISMPPGLPDDAEEFAAVAEAIDYPLGAAWAGGFLQAIDLRLPQWRILEQQIEGLHESIALLLRLIQLEPSPADGTAPPDFRERLTMMTAMPYMLRILDHRRRAERAGHATRRSH